MLPKFICPSCGAVWPSADQGCQNAFYQMLYWENEDPRNGEVHHLAVLCYHLQHPELYSPAGLQYGLGLLIDFIEHGLSPEEAVRRSRTKIDSGRRRWRVTARPGAAGAYHQPVRWSMTTRAILAGGIENYVESVNRWAESVMADLRTSGNLS